MKAQVTEKPPEVASPKVDAGAPAPVQSAAERNFNPVRESFRDVTRMALVKSTVRVFLRIYRLQGLKEALRVFPIVWVIIKAVHGFARYHMEEFERTSKEGADIEAAVLTSEKYEEYRLLGAWLLKRLHALGPTFIKIGQTLSTRADLLPLPAMLELAKLQEEVGAFPTSIARDIIIRELGAPPEQLYAHFDAEPIAAASLSQAYRATLKDGRSVVVKVQRPDLAQRLACDVQVLGAVADEVMNYPSLCRHTDWPAVNEEFARTTFEEIDYIREGRNADRFRHNFRNFPNIYIPRIVWRLTGRRVLTIEFVPGTRVTDVEALERQGFNRADLTKVGANFYLKQLLEDGFFHADPHPGNMRVMPDGRIGIFDFGMVGRLSNELKQHLVNSFIHVIQKDYQALVDDFVGMGFLDEDVDRESLALELTPIINSRFSEGLNRVQFRKVLFDFSDVCYRYPFRLPTEFTYVMRALLTLEGVALVINPDFNFVDAAMPFAQRIAMRDSGMISQVVLKEVFTEGKFNPGAAIKLIRTAARLRTLV
ncbi:MAG: AarF/ABC1/UbiB kinase family protein [Candidatus Melainabacteria bacterium]|nr:AarF/ABC1/UbiB kinase family protein [Candidatus Melainabacteria bacterium]